MKLCFCFTMGRKLHKTFLKDTWKWRCLLFVLSFEFIHYQYSTESILHRNILMQNWTKFFFDTIIIWARFSLESLIFGYWRYFLYSILFQYHFIMDISEFQFCIHVCFFHISLDFRFRFIKVWTFDARKCHNSK